MCSYRAAEKIDKMLEEDKVHQFLMGLDDDCFSTVRSQILAFDPLPSLDKIFNMVQQEENHKRVMVARDSRHETTVTFAMTQPNRNTP